MDATLSACVGLAGLPPYELFFAEFSGFAVGPAYVGVDGKPVGHLIIEAVSQHDTPGAPCIGSRVRRIAVGQRKVTEYRCTNNGLRVERHAHHGEGAQLGHLLLTWDQEGVAYSVSAHGHTASNLSLLKRIVASTTLTPPGA